MVQRFGRLRLGLLVALGLLTVMLGLLILVPHPGHESSDGTRPADHALDVDDYGAKGDGTTDDSGAIQRAVAALRSGETLRFTAGKTYLASTTIEIANKSGIAIVATGAALTTTASSDTSSVLRVENCSHVQVVGGHLFHKNPGIRRNAADGLTINQCSDVVVKDVSVGYVYSMGIRVAGSARVLVTHCKVDGSLADGIGAYGGQRQAATPDATMTSGSTTLVSLSIGFQPHDVGSTVVIPGAGVAGGDLTTTIRSRSSVSEVELADPAQTSVSNTSVRILRPSTGISITANNLRDTGDDAISSVSYLTYSGPNTDVRIQDNSVVGSHARGILLTGTRHAVVSTNTVRDVAMAGVFLVVEVGTVTTWGCDDVLIDHNTVETANTGFGTSNYPAIGAASTADEYPIRDVRITDNVIRDAYSYYIAVGGYSASNGPGSTQDIVIEGNTCVGGNQHNPAIQAIKSTDVTIANNRIADARASAVTITPEVAGRVIVRDNVITRYDLEKSGWPALDIHPVASMVEDNVVDGVTIPSGTKAAGQSD